MTNSVKESAERISAYASDKLQATVQSTRSSASTAATRLAEGIEQNPITAVAGGLALGVLIGALLPRTQKETDLLGTIGQKVSSNVKGAAAAGLEAGQAMLDEKGISKSTAGEQVGKLIDTVVETARTAGVAAVETIRHR